VDREVNGSVPDSDVQREPIACRDTARQQIHFTPTGVRRPWTRGTLSQVSTPPAETPPIRLYTYVMSPYSAKVHCFLHYKQLDFECFYINPLRARKDLPVGKQIPALTIGEESRADSTPIGLWLDEQFPDRPRLLPSEGPERAKLIAADEWISNTLIPASFRSYPGKGIDHILNGWKLSRVMSKTARGGLPLPLRVAWPWLITNVGFVRRLIEQADDGRPVRESTHVLYDAFVKHLDGGPFVGGRDTPSMPDLAAYPQFALYFMTGFRGGDDVLEAPELMAWLTRMKPFVDREPALVPAHVRTCGFPTT
jgi:glutathione S-transferase